MLVVVMNAMRAMGNEEADSHGYGQHQDHSYEERHEFPSPLIVSRLSGFSVRIPEQVSSSGIPIRK